MRDGRDAMISLYFHWARAVPEGDRPRLNRFQRCMFPGLTNKANVRENLPAFLEQQMVRPVATKGHNWGQHVQRFFDSGESNLVLMKYESLLSDPISELRHAIAEIMGEEPDERILEFAVEKHSFARQSGRKRGEEDKKSFLRKAQAGDWRNYFTREAAEVFDRYCGEQLIAAGYEADRNWIDDLGSTTERTMDHAA